VPESGEKASPSAQRSAQSLLQPTPPATPPRSQRSSSAAGLVSKVAAAVNSSVHTAQHTPEATSRPPQTPTLPPVADYSLLPNNSHGFKTMAEALQHIAALEQNSHQALNAQLQKAQQKSSELVIRNAALEEELKSYQAYMRDVVPQYKKQLQYMKQQLKVKEKMNAIPAPAPGSSGAQKGVDGDEFKLPLIK